MIKPIWKECFRVLKKGGILLAGFDNGFNYLFTGENETTIHYSLPFDPLQNQEQYEDCVKHDDGFQFSHTIEEQIGGQLEAGFILKGIYQDTMVQDFCMRRMCQLFMQQRQSSHKIL